MTAIEWVLKLKEKGVLTEGTKNGIKYLHLQTPCKVHLTENATKQLRDSYKAEQEKGGVLVTIPKRVNGITHLTIDKAIFLTNVSETPWNSYRPDSQELRQLLKDILSGQNEKSLPIRFHTHPTHSDNPISEMFNYIFQCNTSEQDQLVSDTPVSIGDLSLLMPRSLVLCNRTLSNRMFIGFYNGLIAPIEFESQRNEQTQKAMESIFKYISEWVKDGNNKWWLIGGGITLALLIIRYNHFAIPLILLLIPMSKMFINDQNGQPEWFAQIAKGAVTIVLPG